MRFALKILTNIFKEFYLVEDLTYHKCQQLLSYFMIRACFFVLDRAMHPDYSQ